MSSERKAKLAMIVGIFPPNCMGNASQQSIRYFQFVVNVDWLTVHLNILLMRRLIATLHCMTAGPVGLGNRELSLWRHFWQSPFPVTSTQRSIMHLSHFCEHNKYLQYVFSKLTVVEIGSNCVLLCMLYWKLSDELECKIKNMSETYNSHDDRAWNEWWQKLALLPNCYDVFALWGLSIVVSMHIICELTITAAQN